jgi:hypothetical protein
MVHTAVVALETRTSTFLINTYLMLWLFNTCGATMTLLACFLLATCGTITYAE